ncbi:MAG: tRNA (adenosine(37)-N6)-dimethylallyltransferase MiaA, partial [Planctomycetales bacterium]|nr:tRNA (adenosine(37)-N6)-dimethylallyltransferase MiaA [Planctomycetales bacterium]
QLQKVDPAAAARLPLQDERRIIRALEVFEVTGQPLSAQQQQQPLAPELRPRHVYWLSPDRAWLHERINRRVDSMFATGLVEEVRHLKARPLPFSRSAAQALGYKETLEFLEGQHSLAQTISLIQTRTRQFAKRQCTWFRNLVECFAVPISGPESTGEVVQRVLGAAGRLD